MIGLRHDRVERDPLLKTGLRILFGLYELAGRLAVPFLRHNDRLADGIEERLLKVRPPSADLWIQAASAGEAYLAVSIIESLKPVQSLNVLITTNTRQGRDILDQAVANVNASRPNLTVRCAFFPFDRPGLMRRAVRLIRPRLMILLETEIWPGLLRALKKAQVKIGVVNGRMTAKSFSNYRRFGQLWPALAPDGVMAISSADAQRFAGLFKTSAVTVMPNIKFDRITFNPPTGRAAGALNKILAHRTLVVLGSIRQEEEADILKLIGFLLARHPDVVIGLCPRHIQRIEHWCHMLTAAGRPWVLRSKLTGSADPGSVIVWDTFGELNLAYSLCRCAFVGGSLVPLGGQNFLEPLAFGIRPVIGPHWDNFAWVGRDIIEMGLVQQVADWRQAGACLADGIDEPEKKATVRSQALAYIQSRQGGTHRACREIENQLN